MTDEDRELLLELRRLNDACGRYGTGVLYDDLSREDQLAFGARLVEMAALVHDRALRTPLVVEGTSHEQRVGDAARPADRLHSRSVDRLWWLHGSPTKRMCRSSR